MGWLTWRRAIIIWGGSAAGLFAFFAMVKIGGGMPEVSWEKWMGYSVGIASFVLWMVISFVSKAMMTEKMFYKD